MAEVGRPRPAAAGSGSRERRLVAYSVHVPRRFATTERAGKLIFLSVEACGVPELVGPTEECLCAVSGSIHSPAGLAVPAALTPEAPAWDRRGQRSRPSRRMLCSADAGRVGGNRAAGSPTRYGGVGERKRVNRCRPLGRINLGPRVLPDFKRENQRVPGRVAPGKKRRGLGRVFVSAQSVRGFGGECRGRRRSGVR